MPSEEASLSVVSCSEGNVFQSTRAFREVHRTHRFVLCNRVFVRAGCPGVNSSRK